MSGDRIECFGAALAEAGIAAALVMHRVGVLYLAGTGQPCNLLVVPGRPPTLFARRFGDLVRRQSHVEHVIDAGGFGAVARELERLGAADGSLGMELDVIPAALVNKAGKALSRDIADCSPPLLALRARKDAREVQALRDAAGLFEAVHAAFRDHARPGIRERELAGEIARGLRAAGHEGVIAHRRWDARLQADGALASGENLWTISGGPITVTGTGLSHAVPHGASDRQLRDGDLVNVDLGLNRAGYHADMARTYAIGHLPEGVERLAHAVVEIEDACLAAVRPGVAASDVYEAGVAAARALGVDAWFQGFGDLRGPYVGHAIGLELDEPPVLGPGVATPLVEGMVLAIEPKLIVPGLGAVNVEDDVVVTADGCDVLGTVPRALFVVDGHGGMAPVPSRP